MLSRVKTAIKCNVNAHILSVHFRLNVFQVNVLPFLLHFPYDAMQSTHVLTYVLKYLLLFGNARQFTALPGISRGKLDGIEKKRG